MEGYHHHRYKLLHQQQQQQHHVGVNVDTSDRFPQWSLQETKEFLVMRAELDRTFMETKRNKLLWEVISHKMKEKGFNRSSEQCKCKWKNLVTRYKVCETMEPEAMRQQFPFYNDLQGIFAARMQTMLWAEAEVSAASASKKKAAQLSLDEEEEDDYIETEGEKGTARKKKKGKRPSKSSRSSGSNSNNSSNLREILEDFMKQQMQMEKQWREADEAREKERWMKEMEWRETMEALENERIMMERRWWESEEQRRMRQEARAEKIDALITVLLNKLVREDTN